MNENKLLVKPEYLRFMRSIANIYMVLGILSASITGLIFVLGLIPLFFRSDYYLLVWFAIGLGITLQFFVISFVLQALADIAENMLDVGNYVKELQAEKEANN